MTIEEAQKVYKKNNCSLFVMAREDLDNYTLYKKLNINEALEQKWKAEVIEDLAESLKKTGDSRVFNQLYDLSISFHDKERLEIMMELIDKLKIEDIKTSLCIAETIMGRKVLSIRSGMIFWAYDIGERQYAIKLIQKVLFLVDIKSDNETDIERICSNQNKIRQIINILGLEKEIT